MLRSLGLRSDLVSMRGVSILDACALGHVMRTPSEPTYWSGNVLIRDTQSIAPDRDVAAFQAAFPDSTHVKILWDVPCPVFADVRAAFTDPSFEVDSFDVLSLDGHVTPCETPKGIVLRPLSSDADWALATDLSSQIAVEEGYDPKVHGPFLERRTTTRRQQIAQGLGMWFGAFEGGQLVGQMGMFHDATVARFQSVETRTTHRRRGICTALLSHVSRWAATRAPDAIQVIVAEADSDAGKLYRRAGFTLAETLIEVTKRGD